MYDVRIVNEEGTPIHGEGESFDTLEEAVQFAIQKTTESEVYAGVTVDNGVRWFCDGKQRDPRDV